MRILANYGYKNNGDSYSVTFETTGDVPKDQGDAVVDELFSMARRAIERQINPATNQEGPHTNEVVIPEVVKRPDSGVNGNGGNGNGKPAKGNGNGNGNGGNGKHHLKEPGAPISPKQKSLIIKLSKQRRRVIDALDEMSMASASKVIEELLALAA